MVRGPKRRRSFLSLVSCSVTAALAGCTSGGEEGNGDTGDDESDGNGSGNGDSTDGGSDLSEADEVVLVGPDGDQVFEPETLEVEPGTTVGFDWRSDGHNVLVMDQPDESDWEGRNRTSEEGTAHVHTFDVEGRYEYECGNHAMLGMDGTILVGDVEAEPDDGNETKDDGGGDGNETQDDGGGDDGY